MIVDASMPAMIRLGGKMYGADGRTKDTKAVNPESTFSRIYQEMINFCKTHGQFDPTTMGTVPNVGLMAQKAEEYGSPRQDLRDPRGRRRQHRRHRHRRGAADARTSRTATSGACPIVKDAAIRDWVQAGRHPGARISGMTVVFWLDTERPHEAELRKKVKAYLKDHDTEGLHIQIMPQVWAMRYTLERVIRGQDTIAATGNILRDYLTDLFPILELGTSAKMLSIVPLMAGGGMYETGRGRFGAQARPPAGRGEPPALGFARRVPRRWAPASRTWATRPATSAPRCWARRWTPRSASCWRTTRARRARPANSTTAAASSTSRMYWAQELAEQTEDKELADHFAELAKALGRERRRDHRRTR